MIATSEDNGGGRSATSTFSKLNALVDRPTRKCKNFAIRVIFHVPGDIAVPDFQGIRVWRYYRKYGYLLIEVEVPKFFVEGDNCYNRNPEFLQRVKDFIITSLYQSSSLADEFYRSKTMPFDRDKADETVREMDRAMTPEAMKKAVDYPQHKPPSMELLTRVKAGKRRSSSSKKLET